MNVCLSSCYVYVHVIYMFMLYVCSCCMHVHAVCMFMLFICSCCVYVLEGLFSVLLNVLLVC